MIDENTSDGYHTFKELYEHRMALTVQVTKSLSTMAYKSKKHSDGTMFDNYFIVVFYVDGKQCSYHYHLDNWKYFNHLDEVEFAEEWDGHTADDVVKICLGE